MDHQVMHNTDVCRAKRIRAHSLTADIQGLLNSLLQEFERRIKPLNMPDLQDRSAKHGESLKCASRLEAVGQRLFDHHGNAGFKKRPGDFVMENGGHGDDRSVDEWTHFFGRREPLSLMFGRNASSLLFA
jgi:hypothetical protein